MICSVNQWTGFYMIGISIKKDLKTLNVYSLNKGCDLDAYMQHGELTRVFLNAVSVAYDLSSDDFKKTPFVYIFFERSFLACTSFFFDSALTVFLVSFEM